MLVEEATKRLRTFKNQLAIHTLTNVQNVWRLSLDLLRKSGIQVGEIEDRGERAAPMPTCLATKQDFEKVTEAPGAERSARVLKCYTFAGRTF